LPAAVQLQPNDGGGLTQVPCPQQGMLGTACPSPVKTLEVLAAIAARQEGRVTICSNAVVTLFTK